MKNPVLTLKRLTFSIGEREVHLEKAAQLLPGKLYLIRGASGSGKSTLARVLLGLTHLIDTSFNVSGDVSFESETGAFTLIDSQGFNNRTRKHLAMIPQLSQEGFVDELSVEENVLIFAKGDQATLRARLESFAAKLKVWPLPKSIARASGGEKMRLSTIRALIPAEGDKSELALLVADEPTSGLDRENEREIAHIIRESAKNEDRITCVITHDTESITSILPEDDDDHAPSNRIVIEEWSLASSLPEKVGVSASFKVIPKLRAEKPLESVRRSALAMLDHLGAVALSPFAFLGGLAGYSKQLFRFHLRPLLLTILSPSTIAFVTVTCAFVAVTLGIFVFHLLPQRELLEPLILEDLLKAFGVMVALVILPVIASLFATAKNAAADCARMASATRSGVRETLAMAGIRIESWSLVPMAISQIGSLLVATAVALSVGAFAGAMTFVVRGEAMSITQILQVMGIGVADENGWLGWLLIRLVGSGFIGAAMAAWFGSRSMQSERDVSKAVHRTLVWSLFAVLAWQCTLIIAQFLS